MAKVVEIHSANLQNSGHKDPKSVTKESRKPKIKTLIGSSCCDTSRNPRLQA